MKQTRLVKNRSFDFTCLIIHFLVQILAAADSFFTQSWQEINQVNIEKHIKILASDSLEGRGTGTRGEQLAAFYIAQQLKVAGIEPIEKLNGYFQNIPFHGSIPLSSSELQLFDNGEKLTFKLEKDYLLNSSGEQTFVPKPVPLVFAGYGIVAPEFDYNDYLTVDVRNKIVVYLSDEPYSEDDDYFNGRSPSIYSYAESKERIAISRGARGSILVPLLDENIEKEWNNKVREFSFEDVTLAYSAASHLSIILHPNAAYSLFNKAPFSLADVYRMHKSHIMKSFELGKSLSFKGVFKERDFFSPNVLGKITGTDSKLKNTCVIISAHYDHLGIGKPIKGDSVYNGVVDNALGTAALIEIAKSLKKTPTKRSVLFLFVTAEEKGALGSFYYLDHPIIPHYKTITNVNIDGLAIFDTFNDIIGFGSKLSTLGNFLERIAKEEHLYLSDFDFPFLRGEYFARSDQIAFARAGIPSILVAEGLDYQNLTREQGIQKNTDWMQNIYHTPFDDLFQPINYQAVIQHCRFLYQFALTLANSEAEPEWLPGSLFINARLQSIAEKR